MKNKIISILCAMAISLTAFAQTNVKGVVTDKNGEAVTGAMVLNKDNGKWAVTDAAGAFELEGAEKGQNLEITCMGYVDFTVSYKGLCIATHNPFYVQ